VPGGKPIGKLDLYPGDKILIFRTGDGKVMTAEAWCGPPHELPLLRGQSMPATPTKSGSYLIWGVEPQSHGCIHMAPIQLQRMNAHGAFIRGTALTIHTYSEHHGR